MNLKRMAVNNKAETPAITDQNCDEFNARVSWRQLIGLIHRFRSFAMHMRNVSTSEVNFSK